MTAALVLKTSAPFDTLPDDVLQRIAEIGRPLEYRAGETIYAVNAPAQDVYVVLEGEVEHTFDPGQAVAPQPVRVVGQGSFFGWAALLKDSPGRTPRTRLATSVSLRDTKVLAIDAMALIDLLRQCSDDTLEQFRNRLLGMVTRMYGFAGFVKVRGEMVPAHIPRSDEGTPPEFDTFAF